MSPKHFLQGHPKRASIKVSKNVFKPTSERCYLVPKHYPRSRLLDGNYLIALKIFLKIFNKDPWYSSKFISRNSIECFQSISTVIGLSQVNKLRPKIQSTHEKWYFTQAWVTAPSHKVKSPQVTIRAFMPSHVWGTVHKIEHIWA